MTKEVTPILVRANVNLFGLRRGEVVEADPGSPYVRKHLELGHLTVVDPKKEDA